MRGVGKERGEGLCPIGVKSELRERELSERVRAEPEEKNGRNAAVRSNTKKR